MISRISSWNKMVTILLGLIKEIIKINDPDLLIKIQNLEFRNLQKLTNVRAKKLN